MNRKKGVSQMKRGDLKPVKRNKEKQRVVLSTIPSKKFESRALKELMVRIRTPTLTKVVSTGDYKGVKIKVTNDSWSTKECSEKREKKKAMREIKELGFSPIKARKIQEKDQCLADVFSMLNSNRILK